MIVLDVIYRAVWSLRSRFGLELQRLGYLKMARDVESRATTEEMWTLAAETWPEG